MESSGGFCRFTAIIIVLLYSLYKVKLMRPAPFPGAGFFLVSFREVLTNFLDYGLNARFFGHYGGKNGFGDGFDQYRKRRGIGLGPGKRIAFPSL